MNLLFLLLVILVITMIPHIDIKTLLILGILFTMILRQPVNRCDIHQHHTDILPKAQRQSELKEGLEVVMDKSYETPIHEGAKYNQESLVNSEYSIEKSNETAYADRMAYMSTMDKRARINRANYDKYSAIKYFDEELNDGANRHWWDNQDLESEF